MTLATLLALCLAQAQGPEPWAEAKALALGGGVEPGPFLGGEADQDRAAALRALAGGGGHLGDLLDGQSPPSAGSICTRTARHVLRAAVTVRYTFAFGPVGNDLVSRCRLTVDRVSVWVLATDELAAPLRLRLCAWPTPEAQSCKAHRETTATHGRGPTVIVIALHHGLILRGLLPSVYDESICVVYTGVKGPWSPRRVVRARTEDAA